MSIYAITLKRELLGGDDETNEAEQRLNAELTDATDRRPTTTTTTTTGRADEQRGSSESGASDKSPVALNEANWLDCLCDVNLGAPKGSEREKQNNERTANKQSQHSDECLANRRQQLQRLQAKAREIVHSVNVTLEISADLREAKRILWYKDKRELTSTERPVLYVRRAKVSELQGANLHHQTSIKRTKSTSKTRNEAGETYLIEQTHEEIVEQRVLGERKNQQQAEEQQSNLVEKCRQESNERGSKLTIFDLQDNDYGQYICRLIDSEGKQLGDIKTQLHQQATTKQELKQVTSSKRIKNIKVEAANMDEVIEVKEGDLNIELGIQILPETNDDEELMSEEEKKEFIENTTISWFKDDVKINPQDAQVAKLFQFSYDQTEGFHRLIVLKASKQTEGVYTCLVENESGTSSCSTQLVVGPGNKPKLTSQLQDVTVYVGQSLEFRIKSTGLPPIDSCQWFKDDQLLIELDTKQSKIEQVIKSARNERISMSRSEEWPLGKEQNDDEEKLLIFRLCIEQLKLEDTGRYKCRIINEHGYDESDCMVKVLQEIIEEHEEIEETIEETLRLGGGKKSSQEQEEQTTTTTTTTTVTEREDEARSQKRQKKDLDEELMQIDGKAPEFRRKLQSKTVILSEETSTSISEEFVVTTKRDEWSRSSDQFGIRWLVDGKEISPSSATTRGRRASGLLADNSELSYQVENFAEETSEEIVHRLVVNSNDWRQIKRCDSLKIECEASNEFGSAQTSCSLRLTRKPRFLKRLEDVETSVSESVQLRVTVAADDQVDDVRLSKDGKLIYSSRSDGNERELTTSNRSRIKIRSFEETIVEELVEDTSSYTSRRRLSRASASERKQRGRTYEITIDNVQVDQQGSWQCEASNEAGSTSCSGELEVFAEPKLVTDLADNVRVPPRKEIRLSVEASGSPTPVFSWFKEGLGIAEEEDRVYTETKSSSRTTTKRRSSVTSLREEDGVSISGETLIIRDAKPEDEGIYKCKIENRLGQVETRDCKLTIIGYGDDARSAPRIIKDLSREHVYELDEGDSLTLKVLAEGHPRPQQRWFKDETTEITTSEERRVEIEQVGQEYTMTIKRTSVSDSGTYKVALHNDLGSVESKTVTVKVSKLTREREEQRRPSAPKILADSQDKVVGVGSNVAFDVQVAGHPKPLITWYKNGRRLTESGDGRLTFVEEETTTTTTVTETFEDTGEETGNEVQRKETTTIHRLVIKDVRESDEAIYSLKAENDLGSTKSSLVSLTVDRRQSKVDELAERRKKISEQEQEEEIVEEETITTTTTKQVTEELEEEENNQRQTKSKSRKTELQREVDDEEEEGEFDNDGNRRTKTTRTTRTTTTKTTTTTTTEEEEEEEARLRRQRQLEAEKEEEEQSQRSKRRTRVDEVEEIEEEEEEEEEEEKRNKRRGRTLLKEEQDEQEETRSKVVQMELDEEEATVEESSKERRRSASKDTRRDSKSKQSRRRSGQADNELVEEELVEEEEEITEKTKKKKRSAPRIVSAPKELVAGLGSSPELEVEVFEEEIIEEEEEEVEEIRKETRVTWLKNNEPIPDRLLRDKHIEVLEESSTDQPNVKRRTLRINSLRTSDEGEYKLRVEKPQGKAETEPIKVKVDRSMRPGQRASITAAEVVPPSEQSEPEVLSVPEEVVAAIGSSPVIEAAVSGKPKPQLSWFKDGQPISEDELQSGHLELVDLPSDQPDTVKQALKINDLRPADVAAYHVKAESPAGEVESEPTNVRIDRSMAPEDEPIVTGLPERRPVEAAPNDEASAPVILSMPDEVRAGAGSKPQLVAEVAGQPQPQLSWLKDGEPISDRDLRSGHVEVVDLPTDKPNTVKQALQLNDFRPTDVAEYAVKAQNELGEVVSEPTKVKLDRLMGARDEPVVSEQSIELPQQAARGEPLGNADAAPSILRVPEEIKAGPGSSPQIVAEVSGKPLPEITWFKDGRLVSERELRLGHLEVIDLNTDKPNTVKQALKINDLRPTDVAAYHVRAKNPLGVVESEPTNVRLDRRMSFKDEPVVKPEEEHQEEDKKQPSGDETSPTIVSLPEEIEAGRGSSPQIEAEVAGSPQPQLTWLKDGQPIPERDLRSGHVEIVDLPSDKPDTVKQALKINELKTADAAAYQLKAENPFGEVESQPVKLKLSRSMSSQDEPVVKGAPPKAIEAEQQLPEGAFAPQISSAPEEVVAGRGGSPQVEAEIVGRPKPQLSWFKDGQPISEDELQSGHLELVDLPSDQPDTVKQALKINDLKPADVAGYYVKAVNPLGEAESEPTNVRIDRSMAPSDEPVVTGIEPKEADQAGELSLGGGQKAPKIVGGVPKEIVAGAGSSPQIEAEVAGSPQPQLTWLKDGQPIPERDLRSGHVEIVDLPSDKPDTVKQALKIHDLRPSDAAAYTVKADNPLGQVESQPSSVKLERKMSAFDEPKVEEQPEDATDEEKPRRKSSSQQRAPEIVSLPREIVAGPGSAPQIVAEVAGEPKPMLTWLKDGEPIRERQISLGHLELVELPTDKPDTVKQALKINDLRPSDAAAYTVRAENPLGSIESENVQVRLDRSMGPSDEPQVDEKLAMPAQAAPEDLKATAGGDDDGDQVVPTVVSMPEEVVAGRGSSPQVEAEVSGKPLPEITWFKDGQPLTEADLEGGHLQVVDLPTDKPDTVKQALKISELKPADVAAYHVRAENPIGETESNPTNVRIDRSMGPKDEPQVLGLDEQQEVPMDVEDSTSAPRRKSSATSAARGDQIKPQIVSAPQEVVAALGSRPTLEVQVLAEPEAEVQWFKGDEPISARMLRDQHLELAEQSAPLGKSPIKSYTLTVNDFKPSDVGEYKLVAKNPCGQVESQPIQLKADRSMSKSDEPKVVPGEQDMQAPEIVSAPREVVAGAGSEPQIEAQVSGKPTPELSWFKDGQPIAPEELKGDGHLRVIDLEGDAPDSIKQALKIDGLRPADVAAYHVRAENPLGEAESEPTNVRLDRSMGPRDEPVVEGLAKPKLNESEGLTGGDAPSAEREPKIVSVPREIVAGPGSSPQIETEVSGFPKPELSWYKDGRKVSDRDLQSGHLEIVDLPSDSGDTVKQALKINDFKPSDVAAYQVKAENPLGQAESEPTSVKLDRKMSQQDLPKVDGVGARRSLSEAALKQPEDARAPSIVSMPEEVVAGRGSSLQVEAEVSGKPLPEITWFKDGQPLTEADLEGGHLQVVDLPTDKPDTVKQALKINDLKPADVAAYHVRAENPIGETESEPTNVRIDRDMGPSQAPKVSGLEPDQDEASSKRPLQKPKLSQVPKNISAPLGSSPTLSVEILADDSGRPDKIEWLKDGKLLKESPDMHLEFESLPDGTERLQVNNLKPQDLGVYKLRASNAAGSSESGPITLSSTPTEDLRAKPTSADEFAPEIINLTEEVVAGPGSRPELEVHVRASPKADIAWYKDGRPVVPQVGHLALSEPKVSPFAPDALVYTLKIDRMKPSDAATYFVVARNPLGTAESKPIKLKLDRLLEAQEAPIVRRSVSEAPPGPRRFGPQILSAPKEVVAGAGSSPELEVVIKASPAPETQWFKDGVPLDASSKRAIVERKPVHEDDDDEDNEGDTVREVLRLENVRPEDVGAYHVRASNDLGEAQSVPAELRLDRSMGANDEPRVEKNESAFSPEEAAESGRRKTAPSIRRVPHKIVAPLGSSPVIEVEIVGEPKPEVVWLKDSRQVSAVRGHLALVELGDGKTYQLCISNLKAVDQGDFMVVATNELGEAQSAPISLVVDSQMGPRDEPQVIMEQPNGGQVDESAALPADGFAPKIRRVTQSPVVGELGGASKIELEVSGLPAPSVSWLLDGSQVPARLMQENHITVSEQPLLDNTSLFTLSLGSLKPSDAGTYQAVAENALGTARSSAIVLTVDSKQDTEAKPKRKLRAPTIKRAPRQVVAKESTSPVLEIEVTGEPIVEVVWFKNGVKIERFDEHFTYHDQPAEGVYKLIVNECTLDDEAQYTAVATNEAGQAESGPIELRVEARPLVSGFAPRIVSMTDEVVAGAGSSPRLEVVVQASPSAEVTWFRDGQPLDLVAPGQERNKFLVEMEKIDEDKTRYTLTINKLTPPDLGAYHLEAANAFGSIESEPINVRIDREMTSADQPVANEVQLGSPDERPKLSTAPLDDAATAGKRPMRAPQIKRMPRRIVAGVGSSPVIELIVSGEPKPQIVWYKNGKRVEQSERVTFEELPNGIVRLRFSDLKMTDQAEYSLTAINEAGQVESGPIELIVERSLPASMEPCVQEASELPVPEVRANAHGPIEAPTIRGLESTQALPGSTVKLEAEVLGNPKPEIKWLKDGDEVELNIVNEVPNSNRHSLTLRNVSDLYDGVYALEATNVAGTARKEARLSIVDELVAKDLVSSAAHKVQPSEPVKRKPSLEEAQEKPFIKRGLKFSQVNQGRSIKFEVQIDGKYDELIWMKDGQQINAPLGFELMDTEETIVEAKEEEDDNDDVSTLKASDDDDDDEELGQPAAKGRKFPPRILMRPRNIVTGPGSRVAFEVSFEGEPRPEVTWFRNGNKVTQSSDGKLTIEEVGNDFVRLVIEDVQNDDTGAYYVQLENAYGSERSPVATLEVDADMPASDDLANFSAAPLLGSDGAQLKRGRAPRILQKPRSVHVARGSRVVFETQVVGEPEPVVSWFRDGRLVKQSADGHLSIEEFSNGHLRLVIDNVQPNDVAQYHLVAENKHGSERSIPVTLTLDELADTQVDMTSEQFCEPRQLDDQASKRMRGARPPRILLRPKRLEAPLGSRAQLEVNVVGQSKASIVWYKDGKQLKVDQDERVVIEKVSDTYERLVIKSVESQDAAVYTVSAENDFGLGMSHGAHLIVSDSTASTMTTIDETTHTTTTESFFERYVDDGCSSLQPGESPSVRRAPRFTLRPRNKRAPVGSRVDFEVRVSGEPKADVVWYKNGRRLHTTADGRVRVEEFSDGGSRLILEDLKETDHGVYAAEATNEWGQERTEEVQLRVTQRTETSERIERTQRGTARVTTRTKKTRSHYTFAEERNGYVTLTISDAQLEHDGDYKLIVRNKWGEASTQAPLVVIPKVEPRSTLGGVALHGEPTDLSSSESGRSSRARRTPFEEFEDYGHELDKSVGMFGSESRYQSGEDTYLLQLRDTEFPLRLRKYLRFGARQSPSLRSSLMDAHWGSGQRVTIRERRKFREVMDEEIDDEKMGRDTRPTPMRLQQEVGTCNYAAAQLEHLRVEAADRMARKSAERAASATPEAGGGGGETDMMPPFFRVKLKDAVVEERGGVSEDAIFYCLAAGEPRPDYTWFRNDVVITPDIERTLISSPQEGGSELRIKRPHFIDSGCYKCVARNVHGNVTSRARLRVATRPSRPEPPECVSVSANQVFLRWRPPRDYAADPASCAEMLGYRLELSESSIGSSDEHWQVVASDVGHEFYVVDDLKPASNYSFRVSARNKFGWSDSSYSAYVTTSSTAIKSDQAAQRLVVPHEIRERQFVSEVCDSHTLRHCEEDKFPRLNYAIEQTPVSLAPNSSAWKHNYTLQAEIARGRFSIVCKGVCKRQLGDNEQNSQHHQVALKFVSANAAQEAQAKNEFDILRSLQHEKVVTLVDAYRDDSLGWILIMERLSGLDVLTYLSSFTSYTEETVSKIIQQVMDAIEYLHFRGMCLLELQPDNVVMTNGRTTSLKLVDFSAARFVPRSGTRVPLNESQSIEYCPPEVIAGHEVSTASDVWCIGVLTYVLLSGFSPFKGETEEETRENVRLGRYKYDHIYPNCTPEVTRFLINVFKKHSSKRPTIEQLYENKWLLPNEFMIRKRQHATFRTDKIAQFAEQFHRFKRQQAQGDSLQQLAQIIREGAN